MNNLTLYNYFRSSTSYRIRIALELKHLKYDYKPVHLLNDGGEQNKEIYRKLNPAGGVPTLVHNDKIISQSLAILEYLDDAFPKTYALFPRDPYEKAKVRQCCEIINSDLHALQNLRVQQYLEKNQAFTQADKEKWCQHWISQSFAALEKMLQSTSIDYCFDSTITAADVLLVPQMISAERFKTDLTAFPTLIKIYTKCLEHPAFIKAHPFRQIDTPAELKIN